MKKIIQDIEESGQSRKLVLNKYNSQKEINKNRTKSIESAMNKRHSDDDLAVKRNRDYGGSQSVIKRRKNWFNPMIPRPKLKRKGIIVDYLLQKRVKRQEKEMLDPDYKFKNNTNWDAFGVSKSQRSQAKSFSLDYNDTTILPQSRFDKEMKKPEELILQHKLEIIRTQAKKIEEDAMEKEKNMKLTNGNNVRAANEINNMLIQSINAKLHILKDI